MTFLDPPDFISPAWSNPYKNQGVNGIIPPSGDKERGLLSWFPQVQCSWGRTATARGLGPQCYSRLLLRPVPTSLKQAPQGSAEEFWTVSKFFLKREPKRICPLILSKPNGAPYESSNGNVELKDDKWHETVYQCGGLQKVQLATSTPFLFGFAPLIPASYPLRHSYQTAVWQNYKKSKKRSCLLIQHSFIKWQLCH